MAADRPAGPQRDESTSTSNHLIVDAHAHVWSRSAPPDTPEAESVLRSASARDLFHQLDGAGIAGAVCIQSGHYGLDHTYLNNVLARYGSRIAGVCLVDHADARAPHLLQRLVGRYGYRGVRVHLMKYGGTRALVPYAGLWECISDLGLVISVLLSPDRLRDLSPLIERYPKIPFVVDHLGRCGPETPMEELARLFDLVRHPNAHVKVSGLAELSGDAFPYVRIHPIAESVYSQFGPGRLLWGTDFPYNLAHSTPYRRALDAVSLHMRFIDPGHLPLILGANAMRIYGLGPRAIPRL